MASHRPPAQAAAVRQLVQIAEAVEAAAARDAANHAAGLAFEPASEPQGLDARRIAQLPVQAHAAPRGGGGAGAGAGAGAEDESARLAEGAGVRRPPSCCCGPALEMEEPALEMEEPALEMEEPASSTPGGADAAHAMQGHSRCAICLGDYEEGENVVTLPCLHRFHQASCAPLPPALPDNQAQSLTSRPGGCPWSLGRRRAAPLLFCASCL